MKIKCPFCKNESVQSEIDSSIDEKGNIFFTCPSCSKESVDIEWKSGLDSKTKNKLNKGKSPVTFLTLCKTEDGYVHFCDQSGLKTFCDKEDFEIINVLDIKKYTMCDECMNRVSELFGIPIEAMKIILGLDDGNE